MKPPLKGEGDRRRRWRGFEAGWVFLGFLTPQFTVGKKPTARRQPPFQGGL